MMNWIDKQVERIKNSWRSWTIWFNGIGLALMEFWPDLVTNFPTIQSYISETIFKRTMGAILIINIILRFKTTRDLADKSAPKV